MVAAVVAPGSGLSIGAAVFAGEDDDESQVEGAPRMRTRRGRTNRSLREISGHCSPRLLHARAGDLIDGAQATDTSDALESCRTPLGADAA